MRKVVLCFFLLSAKLALPQEPTNASAKTQYKSFLKAVEKAKSIDPNANLPAFKNQLTQAESAMNSIKKMEPAYNTSAMEEEIKSLKGKLAAKDEQQKADRSVDVLNNSIKQLKEKLVNPIYKTAIIDPKPYAEVLEECKKQNPGKDLSSQEKEIQTLLETHNKKVSGDIDNYEKSKVAKEKFEEVLTWPGIHIDTEGNEGDKEYEYTKGSGYKMFLVKSESALDKPDKELASDKARVEEFLKSEHLSYLKDAKNCKARQRAEYYVKEWQEEGKKPIDEKINHIKTNINLAYGLTKYYELASEQIRLNAYKKAFPDNALIATVSDYLDEQMKALGSAKNVMKLISGNEGEEVKKRKLSPPVKSDPALEAEIRKALEGKDGTIVKISLTSKEWGVVRNELTGIAIKRAQDFQVVMKTKAGKCMIYYPVIVEDFDGKNYLQGYITGYGGGREMLCENVK